MISKIDNKKIEIAKEIYSIFQTSYKIEAELLQATNFPPLNRTTTNIVDCNNTFYAYYLEKDIKLLYVLGMMMGLVMVR